MTVEVETTDAVEEVDQVDADGDELDVEEVVEDPVAGLKAALAAERKARRDADKRAKTFEQQLADKDKPAEEATLEQARREAREEVLDAANKRLVQAELKASLTGKVSNPALALRLIDASEIEVDASGVVDEDAVDAAISALLVEAPELAMNANRFQGGADQGAKGKNASPSQMTYEEVKKLSAAGRNSEIVAAKAAGRLDNLLNGKG